MPLSLAAGTPRPRQTVSCNCTAGDGGSASCVASEIWGGRNRTSWRPASRVYNGARFPSPRPGSSRVP